MSFGGLLRLLLVFTISQTLYHRRVRERSCVVGDQPKATEKFVKNCACIPSDFEWSVDLIHIFLSFTPLICYPRSEFNYAKNSAGECVLVPGTTPLPDDDSCRDGGDYWYERTAYRKIPYSSCEDGERPDRGARHLCPGIKAHGAFFWLFVIVVPFAFTALVAYWYYRRSGLARG